MTTIQIPDVPSPCPLSVGGTDAQTTGDFRDPVTWMRDSKTITMEVCDPPTKFTAMDSNPDYLTDLLYQFGAFKSPVIKKEWLVALLQQLKQIASTKGSDSSGETEWTHPDLASVCRHPHSKATKPELLAHLAAWCDVLDVEETSDWGSIGTYKEPLELVAIFKIITLRLQERIDELCRAGGLVNAPYVGVAIASALATTGKFDHGLLKSFIWKTLHVFAKDMKESKGTRHRFHASLTRLVFLDAHRQGMAVPSKKQTAAWLAKASCK